MLESGFDPNHGGRGDGGRLFGRQASVGLTHAPYGAPRFDRHPDTAVDDLAPLTAVGGWGGALMSRPFDHASAERPMRPNPTVEYASPRVRALAYFAGAPYTDTSGVLDTAGGGVGPR